MGISGLLQAIKKCSCTEGNIRDYHNKALAVDCSSWLHKSVYSIAEHYVETIEQNNNKPDTKSVQVSCSYVIKRCQELLTFANIRHIYLVMDGKRCPLKSVTNEEREQKRREYLDDARRARQNGQTEKRNEKYKACIKVVSELARIVANEVQRHFDAQQRRQNGRQNQSQQVTVVWSPYEADAQMIKLCLDGLTDVIVTEDSDVLVYTAACQVSIPILFKLDRNTGSCDVYTIDWLLRNHNNNTILDDNNNNQNKSKNKKLKIKTAGLEPIIEAFAVRQLRKPGLGCRLFVQSCVLAGCDYSPNQLSGVGLISAFKYVQSSMYRANDDRFRNALNLLPTKIWKPPSSSTTTTTIPILPPNKIEYEELLAKSEAVFYYHPVKQMSDGKIVYLGDPYQGDLCNEHIPNLDRFGGDWSFLGDLTTPSSQSESSDAAGAGAAVSQNNNVLPIQQSGPFAAAAAAVTTTNNNKRKRDPHPAAINTNNNHEWIMYGNNNNNNNNKGRVVAKANPYAKPKPTTNKSKENNNNSIKNLFFRSSANNKSNNNNNKTTSTAAVAASAAASTNQHHQPNKKKKTTKTVLGGGPLDKFFKGPDVRYVKRRDFSKDDTSKNNRNITAATSTRMPTNNNKKNNRAVQLPLPQQQKKKKSGGPFEHLSFGGHRQIPPATKKTSGSSSSSHSSDDATIDLTKSNDNDEDEDSTALPVIAEQKKNNRRRCRFEEPDDDVVLPQPLLFQSIGTRNSTEIEIVREKNDARFDPIQHDQYSSSSEEATAGLQRQAPSSFYYGDGRDSPEELLLEKIQTSSYDDYLFDERQNMNKKPAALPFPSRKGLSVQQHQLQLHRSASFEEEDDDDSVVAVDDEPNLLTESVYDPSNSQAPSPSDDDDIGTSSKYFGGTRGGYTRRVTLEESPEATKPRTTGNNNIGATGFQQGPTGTFPFYDEFLESPEVPPPNEELLDDDIVDSPESAEPKRGGGGGAFSMFAFNATTSRRLAPPKAKSAIGPAKTMRYRFGPVTR